MSLTVWLGVRGKLMTRISALVESAFFFGVVTAGYFLIVRTVYDLIATGGLQYSLGDIYTPTAWFGALPGWMWVLEGAGYLLLITLYWTPGDEQTNEAEVSGLAMFLAAAAAIAIIVFHQAVWGVLQTMSDAWIAPLVG